MPVYCYRCETCAAAFEQWRPMAESGLKPACPQCGAAAQRDYVGEWKHRRDRKLYPFYSEALGVMLEEQIPEAAAELARAGLGGEFDADGRLKVESPSHYRKLCRHMGFIDKRAGMGHS